MKDKNNTYEYFRFNDFQNFIYKVCMNDENAAVQYRSINFPNDNVTSDSFLTTHKILPAIQKSNCVKLSKKEANDILKIWYINEKE